MSLFPTFAQLAAQAGIDPWALRNKLASGNPAEISNLAVAFFSAGKDTDDAGTTQKKGTHYKAEGYRVNDSSPVNASAQVKTLERSMTTSSDHLIKIGRLLDDVATKLDTHTAAAKTDVHNLEGTIHTIETEYLSYLKNTPHGAQSPNPYDDLQPYVAEAVKAVKATGGQVNKQISTYESLLANHLKGLADLGYIPPDEVDEGPGDLDPTRRDGTTDGNTTINATKNKDPNAGLAQYNSSTQYIDLLNRQYKATGHYTDSEYSYLNNYYNTTAKHFGEINTWLHNPVTTNLLYTQAHHGQLPPVIGASNYDQDPQTAALIKGMERPVADGLLNLSKASEQYTDDGHYRGGNIALPQSVQDILNSDIGKVQKTPQDPYDDGPMMRRAEWVGGKNGHWQVDNYDTDTGFTGLLSTASSDVSGGNEFSQSLAQAGIRWKQDENAVETNTATWLAGARPFFNGQREGSDSSDAQALGFPPQSYWGSHGPQDAGPDLGLNDHGASNALGVAAHNANASANLLVNNANDRHAVMGLNWDDGKGASQFLIAGTAPDPHTHNSIRDQAAIKVMQDAGSDGMTLAKTASADVKNALTTIGIDHLYAFATPLDDNSAPSETGTVVLPDGTKVNGISLSNADASNFLKFIAETGPGRYGTLHAAALQQGAQWIHDDPGGSGAAYATGLDGRVSSAGLAAAIDIANSSNADDKSAYAAELVAEQNHETQNRLVDVGLQTVRAGLDIASFGASDHVEKALEDASKLALLANEGANDYGDFSSGDASSEYIKHLQEQMSTAVNGVRGYAAVSNGVSGDQAWMAMRAAAMNHDPHVQSVVDGDGNPYIPPGALQQSNGGVIDPEVQKVLDDNPAYANGNTPSLVQRTIIDPLIRHTYGDPGTQQALANKSINETVGQAGTDEYVNWGDGATQRDTSIGSQNRTYVWVPDPKYAYDVEEKPYEITPH